MASDLISRSTLLDKLNDGNIQTTLNLPIEEVLGEDVDIDDFVMLLQEAIHIYREMVIKVISDQPTAYDVEKAIDEIETKVYKDAVCVGCGYLKDNICTYKGSACGVSKPMLESIKRVFENIRKDGGKYGE